MHTVDINYQENVYKQIRKTRIQQKWLTDLSRYFTEQKTHMVNKHVDKYSILTVKKHAFRL